MQDPRLRWRDHTVAVTGTLLLRSLGTKALLLVVVGDECALRTGASLTRAGRASARCRLGDAAHEIALEIRALSSEAR